MSQRAATVVESGPGATHAPAAPRAQAAPVTTAEPAPASTPMTGDFAQVAVSRPPAGARGDLKQSSHQGALEREADLVAERMTGQVRRARRARDDNALVSQATPLMSAKAARWPGRPLDAATRTEVEQRFGGDFGSVRLHTGSSAARAAAALSARAFTVGESIVFGDNQYNPASAPGRRLLVHELAHTAQQRAGGVEVVQRDVADDVSDKLSYGLFDWAITDSEAIDALALLGGLAQADLAKALAKLGNKYANRLLDNLPDAAKTGAVYQRVIEALGTAGTMSYAKDQLNYGLFDWAITDAEVARVFNIFTTLPAAQQENFLTGLRKAGRLGRLLANAGTGHYRLYLVPWFNTLTRGRLTPEQQAILRTAVEKLPRGGMDLLVQMTGLRYDVTIGPTTIPGRRPVPWEFDKLRKTYLALDHLPEAHVARNKELLRFGQFTQDPKTLSSGSIATVAGVYNPGPRELASNVKASGDVAPTMIHETGHAVDQEMGWSTGAEPAKPARGGWKVYGGSYADCATDMVADSAGGITTELDAAQRKDVIDDIAAAMGNRSASTLVASIRARPWFAGLSAAKRRAVLDDKALDAIPIGLDSPWFVAKGGGEHLRDHVYQEAYPNDWVRYRHEARSRMLTEYQFRKSGEWFAECYAAYYSLENNVKGEKLNRKDPDTKTYFDNFVDTRAPTR